MFHSKMSGKRKLTLDAQVITEQKGYGNEFQYSFKIDKNYFNVIQTNADKYEMRIDNRDFTVLMAEDRSKTSDNNKEVTKKESKRETR